MDYTAAKPKLVKGEVTIKHIIRFFVNYVNNDNLGKIANAHLAWADISSQGAKDPKCITLANLHSEAVDFPKSGKPARMSEDLIVRTFPDFMQKKDKEMYNSQKVLGHIYRSVDKANYKEYKSTLMDETVYDIRMYVPGMEIYIKDARRQRFEYNRGLSAIMNQSGVQTEAEIISGYIIKWLKNGKGKSNYEQHDYTMKNVREFRDMWKKEFERGFAPTDAENARAQKGAAWYYVTYHPEERAKDMSFEGNFLSFPWSVINYVCAIAKQNTHRQIDPKLAEPIPEHVIQERSLENTVVESTSIVEESDDSEEEEPAEESDESDDDDHVIKYDEYAASDTFFNNANQTPTQSVRHSFQERNPLRNEPLEPHQSVLTVDATEEDFMNALLN
jgi:hypothetical protein